MGHSKKWSAVACLMVSVFATGCATIIHGTTQTIGISSQPTGAVVTVDNRSYGATPVFAVLNRNSDHVVTIEMPGYQTTQLTLTQKASGWVWGNLLFGGLIGLAVDAIGGGLYELTPDQINAQLLTDKGGNAKSTNGVYIVSVLQPESGWKKIGNLQPE